MCGDTSGNIWSPKFLQKFGDVVWQVSWFSMANILVILSGENKVTMWKELVNGQ
jgi:hypothetical protein